MRAFRQRGIQGTTKCKLYFTQRVHKILESTARRMVGWDEILQADWDGYGDANVARAGGAGTAVHHGYRGILSSGYYLDYLGPRRYHYGIDPQGGGAAQSCRREQAKILGGEACMWAE